MSDSKRYTSMVRAKTDSYGKPYNLHYMYEKGSDDLLAIGHIIETPGMMVPEYFQDSDPARRVLLGQHVTLASAKRALVEQHEN